MTVYCIINLGPPACEVIVVTLSTFILDPVGEPNRSDY